MSNVIVNKHFKEHNKTLCVLGVLLSDKGISIRDEMLKWLTLEYDVTTVEQSLPGELYEYPAIKYAINLAKDSNELCLYVHTKGAVNKGGIQEKVRHMWKKEFIENKNSYLITFLQNKNDSIIICPFTGPDKNTWFNGFYITPEAAKNTQELVPQGDRYFWESLYRNNENVKIIGTILNNIKDEKTENNINYLIKYIKETY